MSSRWERRPCESRSRLPTHEGDDIVGRPMMFRQEIARFWLSSARSDFGNQFVARQRVRVPEIANCARLSFLVDVSVRIGNLTVSAHGGLRPPGDQRHSNVSFPVLENHATGEKVGGF